MTYDLWLGNRWGSNPHCTEMAKRSTNSTKNFPSSPQSPFGFGGIIGNLYWNITFFSLQSIASIELSFSGIKGIVPRT